MSYEIASTRAARAAFLREVKPRGYKRGRPQNAQPCDVRASWCDWVDAAARAGRMSERLADKVTL